jgi:hypothetical protein
LDEGQYLFAPGARVETPPELINWLMTALYNEHIPFVISATSEFTRRRAVVERYSTWRSEQLRRRIRRYFALPEVPTKDDLTRVARKLLPDAGADAINYVVGYSLVSKGFFQAITDAIEDARLIARRAGRAELRFADLKAAITDWRSPSDAALQRVLPPEREHVRRGRPPAQIAPQPDAETAPDLGAVNGRLTQPERPISAPAGRELSLVSN